MIRFPVAFTLYEGGEWLSWGKDFGPVDSKDLNQRNPYDVLVADDVTVHSLRFEDEQTWDCINGWRT